MSDLYPQLAYLVLLLIAVGGFLIVEFRTRPGQTLRQVMAWGLIFLGVTAVAALWPDIRNAISPRQEIMSDGRIEVPMGNDGHFHLVAELNGVAVNFMVDTGATSIALSPADARKIGINMDDLAYVGQARTANGLVETAPVIITDFRLGDFSDHDVHAMVNGAEMDSSLLGMSYLSRFARVSIEGDRLILER